MTSRGAQPVMAWAPRFQNVIFRDAVDEVDAVVQVVEELLREALGKYHAAFPSGLRTEG